jgi:hypothetical protein
MSRVGQLPSFYRIRVEGELDPDWSAWFAGLAITHDDDGNSTLAGLVADQAALCGLIGKICDLGLVLLHVARAQPDLWD